MKTYFVYMLASEKNGTTYIGVTNDLLRRVIVHKQKKIKGFTKKYAVTKLIWYNSTSDIAMAISKEKQLKKWNRKWKIREIEKSNPEWRDLFYDIGGSDELLDLNFGFQAQW